MTQRQIQIEIQGVESQISQAVASSAGWDREQRQIDESLAKQAEEKADAAAALEATIDQAALTKIQAGLEKISERIASFTSLQQENAALLQDYQQAQRQVAVVQSHVAQLELELADKQSKSADLDRLIGTACRECGKVYAPEDMTDAQTANEKLIEELAGRLSVAKDTLDNLAQGAEKRSEAFTAHQATLPDVSQLSALQSRLEAERGKITDKQRQVEALRKDVTALEQRRVEQRLQNNPFTVMLENLRQSLVIAGKKLSDNQLCIQSSEADLLLHKAAVDVFGPAGVRAQILDTVTPYLNERTAIYLGTLSDGNITANWQTLTRTAKGELKEKFTIDVTSSTGGEGFKALSGGEKRKVRLATAFALSDLVASRATKPLPVSFYDEVDDSIDATGLERLMEVLEVKARERGTLFVISHNDISGYIRNTITVCKKDGYASIM